MTTSTPRAERPVLPCRSPRRPALRGPKRRGFTLTEVLISATLSVFILAGVLSTFLLLGRTGLNASAYAEMNSRLRVAVERFNRDVRLASDVRWVNERSLTLVLPEGSGPEITYAFEPAADPGAPGRFIRQVAGAPASETLVRDIAPDFAFRYYSLPASPGADTPAENALETHQIEVRLRALRPDSRAPSASQLALSARCVLRNKASGA